MREGPVGATRFALAVLVLLAMIPDLGAQELPENLAPTARISANSEYSGDYQARFVAGGDVPAAGGHDDVKRAWCVKGETHRDGAELTFEWDDAVAVKEVVYYARTAWFPDECWKDYGVFLDDSDVAIRTGTLRQRHGPQRISLSQPARTRKLALRFTSSYGGLNPGASEVQIFATRPSVTALKSFMRSQSSVLRHMPWVDRVEAADLARLIDSLEEKHGARYARAEQHRARLAELERAQDNAEALAALQREVLLFDVDQLVVIKRHEITASHVYTYHYEGFRPGGGLYVLPAHDLDAEPLELAASPTGQILDCDLSYDGRVVLFSWRREQDEGYHLWQVNVDGTGLKQLTNGRWHDYNGCWLPDGGIAFLSTRAPQFAYCWHAPVGVVYRMEADGSNVRRLSANYLNDFTPYVLEDGRIIYSRWEYVDRPAIPIQSLWTINPDGTGLSVFFGNRVLSPGTFMEARPIPGTTKIICTMTGHNGPTRGAIGVIDRSLGVNAQAAIANLTPDVPVPAVDQGNGNTDGTKQYSCPFPLDADRFLVSIQGPLLVRDMAGGCQSLVLPAPDDGMQYFNAQPIRPRYRAPAIPPTLAGSDAQGDDSSMATVYLQDVYQGLLPHVQRGDVQRIRVVRELQKTVRIDPSLRAFGFQFPVISCGATYAGKDVLGEAPVEADGSAYFRVPAGVPLYFMALDAEGRAVQRMRSFTHFMPGEVQGCVGCHEPRRHTPSALPRRAATGSPRDLEPPEWGRGGFGYTQTVQPVLDRYCVKCHNASEAPKGVDLSGDQTDFFNVSYDVLARERQGAKGSPYVNWIPTYNGQEQNILEVTPKAWGSYQSKLADIVRSGHPDGAGKARFAMDGTSRRRIFAWIDLNVPYYATSETAYPENVGCRRIYPGELDARLAEVAKRRCAECHDEGALPRREWTRITRPEFNGFLRAPLAKAAGGTERCGKPVFESTNDPDYQALLATLAATEHALKQRPRMDMANAEPAPDVCRDCQ